MSYQLLLCIFLVSGKAYAQTNFTYSNQALWGASYSRCNGIFQSPIAIRTRNTIPRVFPQLTFFRYRQPLPSPLILRSKSDSVEVSTTNRQNLPYVRGGPLRGTYLFDSFHFHWGSRNDIGSEHVLNGRRFPMELHIVHKNSKYATLSQASNNLDGLMVFGILFRVSNMDNIELAPIFNTIRTQNITTTSPVSLAAQVSLRRLFNRINRSRYYFYPGSLTTPTCNQAVAWIVFEQTTRISPRQLRILRNFIGSSGNRVLNNFRAIQPLNSRAVFRSVGSFRRGK